MTYKGSDAPWVSDGYPSENLFYENTMRNTEIATRFKDSTGNELYGEPLVASAMCSVRGSDVGSVFYRVEILVQISRTLRLVFSASDVARGAWPDQSREETQKRLLRNPADAGCSGLDVDSVVLDHDLMSPLVMKWILLRF